MFEKILVPFDGSRLAARVLTPLQRLLTERVELTLVRVVEPDSDRGPAAEQAMREQLEQVRATVGAGVRCGVQMLRGDPAAELVRYARESGQDLVAMATHGRSGIERWIRGSVAERVLRECEVPLLLCNPFALEPREDGPFRRILVPLDGTEAAERVLPLVEAIGRAHDSQVRLLRVEPLVITELPSPMLEGSLWDPAPLELAMAPQRERLEAAGLKAETRAAYGVVAAEVLREARDADLLAMTTHGRTGVARWWFGSVAEQVLRHAPCPVLVVRTAAVRA